MASGKSRHMSAEAVANQVDVLWRHVGGFLNGASEKEEMIYGRGNDKHKHCHSLINQENFWRISVIW